MAVHCTSLLLRHRSTSMKQILTLPRSLVHFSHSDNIRFSRIFKLFSARGWQSARFLVPLSWSFLIWRVLILISRIPVLSLLNSGKPLFFTRIAFWLCQRGFFYIPLLLGIFVSVSISISGYLKLSKTIREIKVRLVTRPTKADERSVWTKGDELLLDRRFPSHFLSLTRYSGKRLQKPTPWSWF